MDNIINIYNKILYFKDEEINFILDTDNIIWFKFANIANILEYKKISGYIKKTC